MTLNWIGPAIGAVLLAATGAALAQVTPVQPQPSAPNMPAPQTTPPEKVEGQNLSEKLNQNEGVIRPPTGVDPDITVKPPVANPNSTIVITPPGEPGGNQSVQPK